MTADEPVRPGLWIGRTHRQSRRDPKPPPRSRLMAGVLPTAPPTRSRRAPSGHAGDGPGRPSFWYLHPDTRRGRNGPKIGGQRRDPRDPQTSLSNVGGRGTGRGHNGGRCRGPCPMTTTQQIARSRDNLVPKGVCNSLSMPTRSCLTTRLKVRWFTRRK